MSQNTVASYCSDVAQFLSFYKGDIAAVGNSDVEDFLASCDSLSKRSQARMLSALRSFCKWLVEEGMNHAQAEKETAKTVAEAGCSEHHLGLAVDIADKDAQQWLQEHSWEYGFILRYPGDKTVETGLAYDPGHYRYVGREAAKEMWESGLCLEEYLRQYQ